MRAIIVHCLVQLCAAARIRFHLASLAPDSFALKCCCRKGACKHNEHVDPGFEKNVIRGIEHTFGSLHQCCVFREMACSVIGSNQSLAQGSSSEEKEEAKELCESEDQKEIDKVIMDVKNETCRKQLTALTEVVAEKVNAHERNLLHGTVYHKIHNIHAAEQISRHLLVGGATASAFKQHEIGAGFFQHFEPNNLLWNGMEMGDRKMWKQKLRAAELSRGNDTVFAEIVEDSRVRQLRACNYDEVEPVRRIWSVSSLSFAGLAPDKPLVILIGKNEDNIRHTMLWKTELTGVAMNPPRNVSVISVGDFNCQKLMPLLKGRIEEQVPKIESTKEVRNRWTQIQFSCRKSNRSTPDDGGSIAEHYTAPFETISLWVELYESGSGGGSLYGKEWTKEQCLERVFKVGEERGEMDPLLTWTLTTGYLTGKPLYEGRFTAEGAKQECHKLSDCVGFYHEGGIDTENTLFIRFFDNQNVEDGVYTSYLMSKKNSPFCQRIQEGKVFNRSKIDDSLLEEISKKCPELTEIDLHGSFVTDEGVKELARNCKGINLQSINLEGTRVSDKGWKELARNWPDATTEISLTGMKIRDAAIQEVAKVGTNLVSIELKGTDVTDIGIKEIGKICAQQRLCIASHPGSSSHVKSWRAFEKQKRTVQVSEGYSIGVPIGAEIVGAWYGGNTYWLWGETSIDVTAKVKELIENKQPVVANNANFGDPMFGRLKYLTVEFEELIRRPHSSVDAKAGPKATTIVVADDWSSIGLPLGAKVVRAWYGNEADGPWGESGIDVTERVKDLIREDQNRILIVSDKYFDTSMLYQKQLAIEFEDIFQVGDRVQAIDPPVSKPSTKGTVKSVNSDGDPTIEFEDGSIRQPPATLAKDYIVFQEANTCRHVRMIHLQGSKHGMRVTDASLEELAKSCQHLENLKLLNTQVTVEGIKELKSKLSRCRVFSPENAFRETIKKFRKSMVRLVDRRG